jgi:hypothetical protein
MESAVFMTDELLDWELGNSGINRYMSQGLLFEGVHERGTKMRTFSTFPRKLISLAINFKKLRRVRFPPGVDFILHGYCSFLERLSSILSSFFLRFRDDKTLAVTFPSFKPL